MGELWECVIWWERTDRIITFKQSADYPLWYLNNRAAAAAARERETERIIFMKSNFFFFFVVRCFVWEQKKNRKKKKGRKTAVESSPPPQHVKFLWQSPTNASRARKAWFFCFFFSWNFFFLSLEFFSLLAGRKRPTHATGTRKAAFPLFQFCLLSILSIFFLLLLHSKPEPLSLPSSLLC